MGWAQEARRSGCTSRPSSPSRITLAIVRPEAKQAAFTHGGDNSRSLVEVASSSALDGKGRPAALRWCGSIAPPAVLATHLSAHQLELLTGGSDKGPTRIRTVGHAAQLLAGKRARLDGRRVGVLHPEPGAADALAQTLRQRGAQVAVLSLDPQQLARIEALDPEVIVVEPGHFTGSCWPTLRAVFEHPQLRWTCVLVSTPELVAVDGLEAHDLSELSAQVQLLCAEYDAAVARARNADEFDVGLEVLGPARVLRLLMQSGKSWRVDFTTAGVSMELDVVQDLLVGVHGAYGAHNDHTLLGTDALNILLREVQGSVHARTVERPAVTNVMCPLDAALAGAHHGRLLTNMALPRPASLRPSSPLRRSLPAPSALSSGVRSLVTRSVGTPASKARSLPPPTALATAALAGPRKSIPATAPAALASPEPVSLPAGDRVTAMAAPDNDNDGVQTFDRSSLHPAALMRSLAPSTPTSSSSEPPTEAWLASTELSPQPRARRLAKPLVGIATSALVVLGLLALADPAPVQRSAAMVAVAASAPPPAHKTAPARAPAAAALMAPTTKERPAFAVPALPRAPVAEKSLPVPPAASAPAAAPREDTADAAKATTSELAAARSLAAMSPQARARRATVLARQGRLLVRQHQTARAKAAYDRALQLSALNPAALAGRVQLALEEGDAKGALQHATTLVRVRPKSANGQLMLGDAQLLASDWAAARLAWQRAAKLGQPLARARLRAASETPSHVPAVTKKVARKSHKKAPAEPGADLDQMPVRAKKPAPSAATKR
ncbi:MAG: hypothetical protein JWN04_375 [Myxococcaceae bacterium]|nr:hypothetical protein [Myxococcaceae bacterium]